MRTGVCDYVCVYKQVCAYVCMSVERVCLCDVTTRDTRAAATGCSACTSACRVDLSPYQSSSACVLGVIPLDSRQ